MNKIIFTCRYFTIKVRDVVLIIVVILLLLLALRSCQKKETEKKVEEKKEEKIQKVCNFTNENLTDFNKLLNRADLCSERWFKDLDAYLVRLEDQNKHLVDKEDENSETVLELQKKLIENIKKFKENQESNNIDELEKTIKAYKQFYEGCREGK